jgi:hypothetical protein
MLCRSFWSRGVALAVVVALALAVAPSAAALSLDLPQRGLALAWQAVLSWLTGANLGSLAPSALAAKGGVTDPGEPPAPGEEVGSHWDPFG